MIIFTLGGIVGMSLVLAKTGEMNVWVNIFIGLMLLGIVGLISVQCIYRVTKPIKENKSQVKTCDECGAINDADAEFCKQCGKKFRNF